MTHESINPTWRQRARRWLDDGSYGEWRRERRLDAAAPAASTPMQLLHDYEYEYSGFHPAYKSLVRVRVFNPARRSFWGNNKRQVPIIVLTQSLPELTGTSLTNLIEAVSAEVVLAHLDHLIPRDDAADRKALISPPFRIIEHYSAGYTLGQMPGDREGESFAVITFSSYRVQSPEGVPEVQYVTAGDEEWTIVSGNRSERPRFGDPGWNFVGRTVAERMVGHTL